MALPKRPPLTDPIPNANIANVPEEYAAKAPYWDAIVSGNLMVDDAGELSLEGGEGQGYSEVEVKGSWWDMPIGPGLTVDENDNLIPQS